ncbi:hypothetical protein [Pseudanabaena sp. PCC 6802]|uniref:hypothetical protein n=1 Tax=Pseudanabaena sp. PCC 6802 TaxID=118173 RepID=UPI000347A2F4|nr:hypothetical protein [Pseudanabaena sp. PCC 6802]
MLRELPTNNVPTVGAGILFLSKSLICHPHQGDRLDGAAWVVIEGKPYVGSSDFAIKCVTLELDCCDFSIACLVRGVFQEFQWKEMGMSSYLRTLHIPQR